MGGKNYRDLVAWQKAMELVVEVYRTTKSFPADEKFGLTSQLQRAAVSVAANIAEGQGRFGEREFVNFLSIAHGSLRETETHVQIAFRLDYITKEQQDALLDQAASVGRLINGLANSLRTP